MAGLLPTNIQSNMLSQIAAADPEPISGTILKIGASIVGIFSAAHAAAVKREAQTLSAAVPQWRDLLRATVAAYNSGEIDAGSAVSYIEQAKAIYYQQVQPIMKTGHGLDAPVPPGGVGATHYYESHGRFAPIDPCNGACYIAYYFVEPEAQLVSQAISAGQARSIDLLPIVVGNTGGQGGAPESQLQITPPLLPSSIEKLLPSSLRSPLALGVLAILGLVVIYAVSEA